jgi:protein gp37
MARSRIEWTDAVWNPVTGCTKVSAGCEHCYAERMAKRFARAGVNAKTGVRTNAAWSPFGDVHLHLDRLDEPLHWRKPRRVLTCSMGDLFHPDVPDEFIALVWNRMYQASKCTFQVLTKRPERMQKWLSRCGNGGGYGWITHDNTPPARAFEGTGIVLGLSDNWPLPNVWLGTSVEDQATADERIPHLLRCPAALRFVSYEPALGPVDLLYPTFNGADSIEGLEGLGWVIAGGESGSGARPCNLEHLRIVVQQCRAAGVPCFVKQVGAHPFETRPSEGAPPGVENALANLGGLAHPQRPWFRDWTLVHKGPESAWYRYLQVKDRRGGNPNEWPEDLRVREFPKARN